MQHLWLVVCILVAYDLLKDSVEDYCSECRCRMQELVISASADLDQNRVLEVAQHELRHGKSLKITHIMHHGRFHATVSGSGFSMLSPT
jgi:hypothetical protein